MAGEGYSNSAPGLRRDGPTIEAYVAAGYPAGNYPPDGYAAIETAGLAAFRAWQADPHDAEKHAAAAWALGASPGEVVHGRVHPDLPVSEGIADAEITPAAPPPPAAPIEDALAERRQSDPSTMTPEELAALQETERLAGVEDRRKAVNEAHTHGAIDDRPAGSNDDPSGAEN